MNNEEIKNKIIKFYKEGKEDKEIAELVMLDECTVEVFGGAFPKECCDTGDYCENCGIKAIENFLDNYHLENEI